MQKQRVIFVGNGLPRRNVASRIDSFDYVVRSSNCVGFGAQHGSKIDVWCVRADNTKRGKDIAEGLVAVPARAVRQAKVILMLKQHVNGTIHELAKRFPPLRYKPQIVIDQAHSFRRLKELAGEDEKRYPTMGFAVFHAVDQMPELRERFDIWCYGFTWDTVGPDWHNVEVEKQAIESYSWLRPLESVL